MNDSEERVCSDLSGSSEPGRPSLPKDGTDYELNCSDSHSNFLDFRQQEELCDITLIVEGEHFKCHKLILASWSPYFRSMFLGNFSEKDQTIVELKTVSSIGFKTILDCIYTRKITLYADTICAVFQSAHFLNVQSVMAKCVEYMVENPQLQFLNLAITYNNDGLKNTIKSFIKKNFANLASEVSLKDFADLTKGELVSILESDDLKTRSEYQVFRVLEIWINTKKCSTDETLELLKHVRVHLFSTEEWDKLTQSSLCTNDLTITQYFMGLMSYFVNPIPKPIKTYGNLNKPRSNPTILLVGGFERCTQETKYKEFQKVGQIPGTDIKYIRNVATSKVKCFDMDQEDKLQPFAQSFLKMPIAISRAQVVEVNNFLYVIGGYSKVGLFDELSTSSKVLRFCPSEDIWLNMEDMLQPRVCFSAAATNTAIYIFAGFSKRKKIPQNRITAVEKYDIMSGKWCKVTDLELPGSVRVASLNDKIYLFFDKSIHVFHESTGEYTPLITTGQDSMQSILVSCHNYLYVVNCHCVERIDPSDKSVAVVSTFCDSPQTITGGCCVNIGNGDQAKLKGILIQASHGDVHWFKAHDSGNLTYSNLIRPKHIFSAMASICLKRK